MYEDTEHTPFHKNLERFDGFQMKFCLQFHQTNAKKLLAFFDDFWRWAFILLFVYLMEAPLNVFSQ